MEPNAWLRRRVAGGLALDAARVHFGGRVIVGKDLLKI
jgi:hypothetical protein